MNKIAAQALEEISRANNGKITAKMVVDQARDAGHPLHGFFTWDDSAAAEKWRIVEARKLIRVLPCTIHTSDEKNVRTVSFVRDVDAAPDQQGYISITRLVNDVERSRETLLAEFSRIQSLLLRVRGIAAALELTDELDALIATVAQLKTRVSSKGEPPEQHAPV